MRLYAVLFALGAALSSGCAGAPPAPVEDLPPPTTPTVPDLSSYKLGIGDRVRIDVYGEPELSLNAVVDPGGRINYPLLGDVLALRKTAKELQDTIRSGLANGYLVNPDVRVTVVQYRPFYIIGQVRKAGSYPYVIGLTVEKALAIAGGLTNLASTRRIYMLREDQPTEKRFRVGLDAVVLPGDTLMVEEGLF